MKDILIAEPIGPGCVVKGSTRNGIACLNLLQVSGCDGGAYYPAQDSSIYGTAQVLALRNFCDKLLEACEDEKEL